MANPPMCSFVSMKGCRSSTIDGPFMETKEHIGGFATVEVSSIDEALELARGGGGAVKMRRLIEAH